MSMPLIFHRLFVGLKIQWVRLKQLLCVRNWVWVNGAFAPEAWVRSASRPYPFFSIRVIGGSL